MVRSFRGGIRQNREKTGDKIQDSANKEGLSVCKKIGVFMNVMFASSIILRIRFLM